jgi:diguanylate cyclase (GGDEF)-like protein
VPTVHLEPDVLGRRLQLGSRQWWRSGGENRVVAEYLLDLRASTGADEAVVWLLNDGDSVLRPLAACSSNQWAANDESDKKWMALVRWSCEAAVVQIGESDDGGGYVTAPLAVDGRMLGVLCLRRRTAFDENTEQLKTRVTHHATFLARLTMLVDTHASSIARSEALDSALDAVRELQDRAPVESPSSAICDAVLQVCGCDASALVRWHSEVLSGSVEAGAGVFESYEQGPVQAGSIVGSTCQRATPFRVGAANDLLSRLSLFRKDEQIGKLGAICVQPMKRDGEVIGALVAGWNSPTDMAAYSAPSMEVLASVGAHALHAAWRLETVQLAARTDALTGLSNRRYLDEQLSRVLAEAGRYGDPASLILLDLDFFKQINDTYGHSVGDMVLKHVAETLLDGIRGVDLCARYGGEELAVLLPRTGQERAVDIAERLRSMVESRPFAVSGRSIRVTASFGVASFPLTAPSPSGLLSSADGALYRAKEEGRNRVRSAAPAH